MVRTHPATSRIPEFSFLEEEAAFWDTHDSTEFEDEFEPVDWEIGEVRSRFFVQVEFDRPTWDRLRAFARERGVPLAGLARAWVLDGYARAGGDAPDIPTPAGAEDAPPR